MPRHGLTDDFTIYVPLRGTKTTVLNRIVARSEHYLHFQWDIFGCGGGGTSKNVQWTFLVKESNLYAPKRLCQVYLITWSVKSVTGQLLFHLVQNRMNNCYNQICTDQCYKQNFSF